MYRKFNFIIETEKLTRCFGDVLAVEQVDLQVPLGSVYGFLGPNGAGKTTTIRMLLGLITPHRGNIRLFGMPFTRRNWSVLARVGSLVESPSLYPNLTGRENLEACRRLVNAPKKNIDEALESVKLTRDANRLVKGYSQGMRQRLGIALALLNKPVLLILDEPTNGLDPAGIQEMRETIRELPKRQGVTVFLSSHLLSEVEQVASHIGIIHKGRLIFQGSLKDLQAQRNPILHLGSDQPDRLNKFCWMPAGGCVAMVSQG
jgi:ABC-2 type transport system ATP-binding protein